MKVVKSKVIIIEIRLENANFYQTNFRLPKKNNFSKKVA